MLTPNTANAVQSLHGTIYERVEAGGFIYHCHAQPNDQALLANAVWQIWRETIATGNLTNPEVNNAPHPDNNIATDPASLPYWATS